MLHFRIVLCTSSTALYKRDAQDMKRYLESVGVKSKDIKLEFSGLSGGFLEGALKQMRVRQQMLVLDTCFSRAVASEYVASLIREKSNFLPNAHGTVFRGRNRAVFTSSDGNEVSLEPKGLGNSLYTYYFLKGLGDKEACGYTCN